MFLAAAVQLTLTLPSAFNVPPIKSTINVPGATVNSLDMPSGYLASPGSWTWSMSPTSNTITVTTTLDANITGQWGEAR